MHGGIERQNQDERYSDMKTIALTGSIGMGKSTVAKMFAALGAKIWDADAAVHRLYAIENDEIGAGVDPLKKAFDPDGDLGLVTDTGIDRQILSNHLMQNPQDFQKLNEIVHPLVFLDRQQFIQQAEEAATAVALFDIPLLYENGYTAGFDYVVVVMADEDLRRQRVLKRPNMTPEKLDEILTRQMPDQEKATKADFVIQTDVTLEETEQQVAKIWAKIIA